MKRILAAAAVILMLISLSSIPASAAVSMNDALISIDFSNGIPEGMEVVGAELVNDEEKGQVLSFAGGSSGSSKAVLKTDILSQTDFSEGLTFTVWAKAAPPDELHGMAPIFTIDFTRVGYLSLCANLVVTVNTDGNETEWGIQRVWSDPFSAAEEVSACENEWAQYTVVIDDLSTYLYINGKLYEENPFANGNLFDIPYILLEEMEYATGIELGSYNCPWWRYGDFKGLISSAAVFNKALSADEVKELYVSTGGTIVEEPVEETEAPAEETAAETTEAVTEPAAVTEESSEPAADTTASSSDSETPAETEGNSAIVPIIIVAVVIIIAVVAAIVIINKKKAK